MGRKKLKDSLILLNSARTLATLVVGGSDENKKEGRKKYEIIKKIKIYFDININK